MRGSAISVEVIGGRERIAALQSAWDGLAARCPGAYVFQDHLWIATWLGHHPEVQPHVVVVWRGGRMTAALPLCAYDSGWGPMRVRSLRFAGDNSSDYCDALCDPEWPEDLAAAWDALMGQRDWHAVDLRYLPATSPLVSLAAGKRSLVLRRHQDIAPHMAAGVDWRVSAPPGLRKEVLRRRRRASERGSVTFEVANSPGEVDEMLDQLAAMHTARWQSRGETSVFHFAEHREWLRRVCQELLAREQLYLCRLAIDGRPASIALAFLRRRRLLRYTSGFDAAYARLGPVHLLLAAVLDDLRARDLADVHDFGRGAEEYKSRWTPDAHSIERILIARNCPTGWAAYLWSGYLKAFIWKNRRLGTALREIRRRRALRRT